MTTDEPTLYRAAIASDIVDKKGKKPKKTKKAKKDKAPEDTSGGGSGGGHSSSGGDSGGHGDFADPLFFAENTPKLGSPETPGRLDPDKRFEMKFVNRKRDMPDGREVEFWSFED